MDVSKEKTEPPTEELMALVTAINKIIKTQGQRWCENCRSCMIAQVSESWRNRRENDSVTAPAAVMWQRGRGGENYSLLGLKTPHRNDYV